MTRKVKVFSIAIPTKNRAADLEVALRSVYRQIVPPGWKPEVLIVDNGSTDKTTEVLKKYPVRVVRDETRNSAHLYNTCWQKSRGEIIAFLNDDIEIIGRYLIVEYLETFRCFPQAAAVGGIAALPKDHLHHQEMIRLHNVANQRPFFRPFRYIYEHLAMENRFEAVGEIFESGAYSVGGSLAKNLKLKKSFPVKMLSMTNAAFPRKIIKEFGGYDETYQFTHHDGDFFLRLREAGWEIIFNPKIAVWHLTNPVGATRSPYFRGRDHAIFLIRHARPHSLRGKLAKAVNILFFNLFWIYKALQLRSFTPLAGIVGFIKFYRPSKWK